MRAEEQLKAQQAVVESAQKNVDAAQADLKTADGTAASAARRRQQRCREPGTGGECASPIRGSRHPARLHQNLCSGDRNGFRARHPPGRGGESGRRRSLPSSTSAIPGCAPKLRRRRRASWPMADRLQGAPARRKAHRRHRHFQGGGERLRDPARCQPPQARYQDHRSEAEGRQSRRCIGSRHDRRGSAAEGSGERCADELVQSQMRKPSAACEAPANGDAIVVDHIVKKYGDFTAVDDVSFSGKAGRDLRTAGSERRRQVHADPHDDDAAADHQRPRADQRLRCCEGGRMPCASASA